MNIKGVLGKLWPFCDGDEIAKESAAYFSERIKQFEKELKHPLRCTPIIQPHDESVAPPKHPESYDGQPIETTIKQRQKTHGDFESQAAFAQKLKDHFRSSPNWEKLLPYQRESLEMLALKVSRSLNGDHLFADTWHDMRGYIKLVEDELNKLEGVS